MLTSQKPRIYEERDLEKCGSTPYCASVMVGRPTKLWSIRSILTFAHPAHVSNLFLFFSSFFPADIGTTTNHIHFRCHGHPDLIQSDPTASTEMVYAIDSPWHTLSPSGLGSCRSQHYCIRVKPVCAPVSIVLRLFLTMDMPMNSFGPWCSGCCTITMEKISSLRNYSGGPSALPGYFFVGQPAYKKDTIFA